MRVLSHRMLEAPLLTAYPQLKQAIAQLLCTSRTIHLFATGDADLRAPVAAVHSHPP